MRAFFRHLAPLWILSSMLVLSGCMTAYRQTVGGDTEKNFTRVYRTDFNTAWQSVLESLKSSRLDVSNQESGYVLTKYQENTAEKNFVDSFGSADAYLKAQYRLKVSLAKGTFSGYKAVKVTIQKEQLVQRDVLEGWRPIETDGIDENTLLYRIGRLIYIRTQLARLEDLKARKALRDSGASGRGAP